MKLKLNKIFKSFFKEIKNLFSNTAQNERSIQEYSADKTEFDWWSDKINENFDFTKANEEYRELMDKIQKLFDDGYVLNPTRNGVAVGDIEVISMRTLYGYFILPFFQINYGSEISFLPRSIFQEKHCDILCLQYPTIIN